MIRNGKGKAHEVSEETEKSIEELNIPGINVEPLIIRMTKEKFAFLPKPFVEREYLVVTNEDLKDFRMYIGARDYGKDLQVSWYLTCEPSFFKGLMSGAVGGDYRALSFTLNLFQQEDLTAYVIEIHHCLLKVVENLMRSLGQAPSKIDRKSKGFLGVS